jgi:hypothetical protein
VSDPAAVLENVIGKRLIGAEMVPEAGVLMLCFPEGKTIYIVGDDLKIELEAAS